MAAERPSFVVAVGNLAPTGILPAAGGAIVVEKRTLRYALWASPAILPTTMRQARWLASAKRA
jgi:hypothetical protein